MEQIVPARRSWFRLAHRRVCWVPSLLGWLVLLALAAGLFLVALFNVYPFLAQTRRVGGGPIVVEGWAGREALLAAWQERQARGGAPLYVTGGPLSSELASITHLKTYADLGAWRLEALGARGEAVQRIPGPAVRKDRTFASALALRQWMEANGGVPPELTLVSEGPHARRSRMLFERAFSSHTRVGIISVADPDYDPRRWWIYSLGFRNVTDELIAYVYARLLFWRSGD